MIKCNHTKTISTWIPASEEDDWWEGIGHFEYEEKTTYVDDGPGRFKCIECNEYGYYTNLWRNHYENGCQLLDEKTGHIKN